MTTRHTLTRHWLGMMAAFAAAAATMAAGCDGAEEPPLRQRLDTLATDLQVGSRGDDVRALHEHLTKYGYFPNAALGERYRSGGHWSASHPQTQRSSTPAPWTRSRRCKSTAA